MGLIKNLFGNKREEVAPLPSSPPEDEEFQRKLLEVTNGEGKNRLRFEREREWDRRIAETQRREQEALEQQERGNKLFEQSILQLETQIMAQAKSGYRSATLGTTGGSNFAKGWGLDRDAWPMAISYFGEKGIRVEVKQESWWNPNAGDSATDHTWEELIATW